MLALTSFRPSTHGLRFANYWPRGTPALTFDTPLGQIAIGDAGNGLCGGFCFAVHDLHRAGRRPPNDTSPPAGGSPLVNYLTRRLIASWNVPGGILDYYRWATRPDHDTLFGEVPGVWRMTVQIEIPKILRRLDAGQPCTLGLITVHSADPADLAYCHQVLAYAYRWSGSRIAIAVYDPNIPKGDNVNISLDTADPARPGPIASDVNVPRNIRGFFAVGYAYHDPAPIAGPPWDADIKEQNRRTL